MERKSAASLDPETGECKAAFAARRAVDSKAPNMPVSPLDMANAIRVLSMDAVHQAKSGHQGMPLGMADVATVLWTKFAEVRRRPARIGPTATASCSRPATARCCSTACCI